MIRVRFPQVLTKDRRIILSSEVGVVDVDEANVEMKSRLMPGKMLLVDFRPAGAKREALRGM